MDQLIIHSCLESGAWIGSHNSDYSDRDRAVKLVTEYFGSENVVSVSNFNNLQLRSLVKDLARMAGMEFMEVNRVTSLIEAEARAAAKKEPGFDASQWVLTFEEAEANSPTFKKFMGEHPDLEKTIKVLFKQQRSLSRHAGGVIITDNAYHNMPVIRSKDVIQTPWTEGLNNRHLEPLGFLKFDILGLGTLRVFENTIRKILKRQGNPNPTFQDVKEWYNQHLDPSVNDYSDPEVYRHVYWEKRFCGVFQFVKSNVQNFISEMQPRSIIDLAIATSIFRPGPLGLKADNLFLENRRDPENVDYEDPVMKEVLGETSGLMIFQEQLQLLVHKMAGWDLGDTDPIRKNFTKKEIAGKEKQLKEREVLKARFVEGCLKTLPGFTEAQAVRVWSMFERWTSYGFNRCLHSDTLVPVYTREGVYLTTKKIQDVQAGEHVLTRDEKTKVVMAAMVKAQHKNGIKYLKEYTFDNGQKVRCTPSHKFRVTDGRMLPIRQIVEEGLDVVFGEENIDHVVCQVCGIRGRKHTSHIKLVHQMTPGEYKSRFPNSVLVCEEATRLQQEAHHGLDNWILKMRKEGKEGTPLTRGE